MAVHSFTGVTGLITLEHGGGPSTVVGFVSGDCSLDISTGKYYTLGNNTASGHTRGSKTASGSFTKAWGVDDDTLHTLFTTPTEFTLKFDNDTDGAGTATGAHTYTVSGCIITSLSIEGLDSDSDGALTINCSWEGLSWTRD